MAARSVKPLLDQQTRLGRDWILGQHDEDARDEAIGAARDRVLEHVIIADPISPAAAACRRELEQRRG